MAHHLQTARVRTAQSLITYGLSRCSGKFEITTSDDHASAVSAFALSWPVTLTLIKSKQISKEDLPETLQRLKVSSKGYAIDELIQLVDGIKIGEGN